MPGFDETIGAIGEDMGACWPPMGAFAFPVNKPGGISPGCPIRMLDPPAIPEEGPPAEGRAPIVEFDICCCPIMLMLE